MTHPQQQLIHVVVGEPMRCGYCGELAREFYSYNPQSTPDICPACYALSAGAVPQQEPQWKVANDTDGIAGVYVYRGSQPMPGVFSNDTELFHVSKKWAQRVCDALNASPAVPALPAPQEQDGKS